MQLAVCRAIDVTDAVHPLLWGEALRRGIQF